MGTIHIDLFTTLDSVAQAPGGPDEDTSGGFTFGGWQMRLGDEVVGASVMEGISKLDALLLGRRTYDIFAGYWPHQDEQDEFEGGITRTFNRVPKYVASRGTPELEWNNSRLVGPDLAAAVHDLRDRHEHVHVIGSVDLVQTLLAEQLFDELRLWVYPLVLGSGKKVFPDGAAPAQLHLLEPATASPNGVLLLKYGPAGVPEVGAAG